MSVDITTIGVEFQTSGLEKGAAALKNAGDAANKAADSADKAAKASQNLSYVTDMMATAIKSATAAFGVFKLVTYAQEATMLAARFETMGVVMRVAGNNAGYTMAQMEGFSKTLQQSGISMLQSRNSLTQLATANIDLAKASKLARAAQDLAVVGNVNSSEALGRMIHGIKSGEVEILRTLGLNVSFEASYKKMALSLGTTSEKLTEHQKVMARTNAALTEANKYNGIYEESLGTAGKAMASLTRYFEDFKVKAGDTFLPVLAKGVFAVTDAMKELNKAASATPIIGEIGSVLTKSFDLLTAAIVPASKVAAAYFALFVGAPAIYAAVSAVVMTVVDATALYAFNVITGTAATIGFNTVLFGTSVNAQLAAGSLTAMRLGVSMLIAAFAGWEIGTYLRENFVEARVAGLAFVGAMMTGWENLKYGAQLAGAAALALVPGTDSYVVASAKITDAHRKELAAIDDNITGLVAYELANDHASKAVKASSAMSEADRIKAGKASMDAADAEAAAAAKAAAALKGAKAAAAQANREYYAALTNDIRNLKAEQLSADKVFANDQAITARNVALRGYTTETEIAIKQAYDYAKAENQRTAAIEEAAIAYQKTMRETGISAAGKKEAEDQRNAAVATANANRDIAQSAADILAINTSLAAAQKITLDNASREKVIRDQAETAYQSAYNVTKAQNDLDRVGLKLTVTQTSELLKQDEIQQAMHDKELAFQAAKVAYVAETLRIQNSGADDAEKLAKQSEALVAFENARVAASGVADAKITVAGIKQATTIRTEWQKTNDRISDGLVAAMTKGGHEGAQAVRAMLIKELVMEPFQIVVRALLQPVTQGLTNTAMGAVGQATGMDLLSGASSASSLYSMGSKAYSWLTGASELGGSAAAFTASLDAATVASTELASGLGTGFFGVEAAAADLTGAFVATAAPVEAVGAAAAVGSESLLAAIPGWGWAAAGIIAAIGLFSGDKGGPKTTQAYGPNVTSVYDADTSATSAAANISKSIESTWDTMAKGLGLYTDHLKIGILTQTDPIGKSASVAELHATRNGQTVFGAGSENIGRSDAEMQTYLAQQTTKLLFTALTTSNLPQQYLDYLNGVSASLTGSVADQTQAMNDAMSNVVVIHDFQQALESLPFEYLTGMSFSAAKGLIEAAGGLDKLGANLAGYYNNFYTATEKTALLTTNTASSFEKLGITMPAVNDAMKAWYRSEVERLGAMDLSVAANATAYAGALALSGQVNTLAGSFDTAAKAADAAAKTTASAWASIMDARGQNGGNLQAQFSIDSAFAAAKATDPSVTMAKILNADKTVFDALTADQQGYYTTIITNTAKLGSVLKGFENDTAKLNIELLTAQGNASWAEIALRKLETNGLNAVETAAYDYNASLQDQISAYSTLEGIQGKYSDLTFSEAGKQISKVFGTAVLDALNAASSGDIKEAIVKYVNSLDPLSKSGQEAIKQIKELSPALDVLIAGAGDSFKAAEQSAADAAKLIAGKAGFDVKGLEAMMSKAISEANPAAAAADFANALESSVRNALMSSVVGQIAESIYASVVTPLMLGAAVSKATTSAIVDDAKAKVSTLASLFASDDFKGLLGTINSAVAPVVSSAQSLTPAANAAAAAVDNLANSANSIGSAFSNRYDVGVIFRQTEIFYSAHAQNMIAMQSGVDEVYHALLGYYGTIDLMFGVTQLLADDLMYANDAALTFTHGIQAAAQSARIAIKASNSAIAETLNLSDVATYFTDLGAAATGFSDYLSGFAGDINDITAQFPEEFRQYYPDVRLSYGAPNGALSGLTPEVIANAIAIGAASTLIGQTILDSITASIPDAIRNDPILAGVGTEILAVIGSVSGGDLQGMNDSFLLLSGALADGDLTAAQYTSAIDYVTEAFSAGADALNAAADSILEGLVKDGAQLAIDLLRAQGDKVGGTAAQRALDTEGYTQAQLSQYDDNARVRIAIANATERNTLQEQLNGLTDTATQALARQRDALDESNRALFDQVQVATKVKTAMDGLASSGEGIQNLVDKLKADPGGLDQMSQMRSAQAAYMSDVAKSRAGDANASASVAASAQAFLDASATVKGTEDQRKTVAQVVADLETLPAVKVYQDRALELAQSQEGLLAAILEKITVGASADSSKTPAWLAYQQGVTGSLYTLSSSEADRWDTGDFQGFAQDTNYLPSDMLAQVHAGERIIPAADNRELMSRLQSPQANSDALASGLRAMAAELAAVRAELAQIKTDARQGIVHQADSADTLRTIKINGVQVWTDPAEPLETKVVSA